MRIAEPKSEPEPPEPAHFVQNQSHWSMLIGAGAGAVRNGAAPAPKEMLN